MSFELEEPTAGFQLYQPTLRERLWRRLGYRPALPEYPDGDGLKEPHWFRGDYYFRMPFRMRVMSLLSGRVIVRVAGLTSEPIEEMRSTATLELEPPGGWRRCSGRE